MERAHAIVQHPFYSNPDWADHPCDDQGNAIVGEWLQSGQVVSVSTAEEHWRDHYGAYMTRELQSEEPAAVPVEKREDALEIVKIPKHKRAVKMTTD